MKLVEEFAPLGFGDLRFDGSFDNGTEYVERGEIEVESWSAGL